LTNFESLGLSPVLCRTLTGLDLTIPTPIQRDAIPPLLQGRDLMGLAQTGTGKTAAFSLPIIQNLMGHGNKPEPRTTRALVLAPTRELAGQIAVNMRGFVRKTHLRVQVVVGGASIGVQSKNLSGGTDILVATPGRLLDLIERKAVRLDQVRYLVLDEADQMLDLGFIHALRKIARLVPAERQTLLFSATMPKQMNALAASYLRDPLRVEVSFIMLRRPKNAICLPGFWPNGAMRCRWFSRAPSMAPKSSRNSLSRPASRPVRSTATRARASASARSRRSEAAMSVFWWQPTWPPGVSIFQA